MKNRLKSLGVVMVSMLASATALAQEGGSGSNMFDVKMFGFLGAGLAIGIAAFGGSLGQGRAAQAALEGIARNPSASGKLFVPLILSLALIESLVIYALIISFNIMGSISG